MGGSREWVDACASAARFTLASVSEEKKEGNIPRRADRRPLPVRGACVFAAAA